MKLQRYKKNPILEPIKSHRWESKAVFNCGVVCDKDKVHMLYRAIGEHKDYISRLGYAESSDGVNFKRLKKPVFKPEKPYERWGVEDPRIVKIGNIFYITYAVLSKHAIKEGGGIHRTALLTTKDFSHFKRRGVITPKQTGDREVALFPEKINGKFVMLHRPRWTKDTVFKKNGKLYLKIKDKIIQWPFKEIPSYFPRKSSIWIAYSKDLKNWSGHKVIMEPTENWESIQVGCGPPPIKTKRGWLLIYHGVSPPAQKAVYIKSLGVHRAGVAILDLKDPSKVIKRTRKPLLEPKEKYELWGDTQKVVFPEGAVIINEEIFVYYGAADKKIGLATSRIDNLLESLFL